MPTHGPKATAQASTGEAAQNDGRVGNPWAIRVGVSTHRVLYTRAAVTTTSATISQLCRPPGHEYATTVTDVQKIMTARTAIPPAG